MKEKGNEVLVINRHLFPTVLVNHRQTMIACLVYYTLLSACNL